MFTLGDKNYDGNKELLVLTKDEGRWPVYRVVKDGE